MISIYKNEYGRNIKFSLFGKIISLKISPDLSTAKTIGIRNNAQGQYIIFLDYDNIILASLFDEIKYLQKKYELSNFYILKSSQKENSYHCICLDKINYQTLRNIINETSCDEQYKTMPISLEHSWVLRILPKNKSLMPKLIKIIKSPYNKRNKSLAHYLFLKYHHGIKNKPTNLDNNKKLRLVDYQTISYI
jgi:hypothetical protein